MSSDRTLQRLWYQGRPRWLLVLLLPLSLLFAIVVVLRGWAYRAGLFRSQRVARPVIVVGNITVGGTGKTPFVIWLVEYLQRQHVKVGIVLRGYGGESKHWPRDAYADTPAAEVGDEAVLHATRTGAIVVAGPDRVAAASRAIARGADIVIADDGLQHYRLARDAEIAVVDAQRALGNRLLLPAGPLREFSARLQRVDLLVQTQRIGSPPTRVASDRAVVATAALTHAVSLISGERRPLESFLGTPVHAVAAIGHPEAFFAGLTAVGLSISSRSLPDHAALTSGDISFGDDAPVFMTEKDAVKCRAFADHRHWCVPLELQVSDADQRLVSALLDEVLRSRAQKS